VRPDPTRPFEDEDDDEDDYEIRRPWATMGLRMGAIVSLARQKFDGALLPDKTFRLFGSLALPIIPLKITHK